MELPPDLIRRIAAFCALLCPNDVPCSLRLVCRAFAAALQGPAPTTVRLSLPAPPEAFAERWTRPDATWQLTLAQRKHLLRLTAASGVVPNLEVAVRVAGLQLEQEVLHAAAEADQLPTCEWLRQQGLVYDWEVLLAAAEGGHLELCQVLRADGASWCQQTLAAAARSGAAPLVDWLLSAGCPWDDKAAGEAARGGHVGVMDALMTHHEGRPLRRPMDVHRLRQGAALGCGLADFTRVVAWCTARRPDSEPGAGTTGCVLAAACLSPTPDWAAKAEWLLDERGYPPSVEGGFWEDPATDFPWTALARPDAAQRLAWMRQRGLLAPAAAVKLLRLAVQVGSAQAVSQLLDGGVAPTPHEAVAAAAGGHLAVLQLLHDRGCPLGAAGSPHGTITAAARAGRVAVLDWLQRVAYPQGLPPPGERPLVVGTFAAAAASCSVAAMAWLLRRGCPRVLADAQQLADCLPGASLEAVELLAQHGCLPMDDGTPFVSACQSVHFWSRGAANYPVLAALRRLGVPWSAATFTAAVRQCVHVAVLRWMVERGCPVDAAAVAEGLDAVAARYRRSMRDGRSKEYKTDVLALVAHIQASGMYQHEQQPQPSA